MRALTLLFLIGSHFLFAQSRIIQTSGFHSGDEKKLVDNFENNSYNWDCFPSAKSTAIIKDGVLILNSLTDEGTSRYIECPFESHEYSIEAEFLVSKRDAPMYGLIYNFSNWENYSFFAIRGNYFLIGSVKENIKEILADWLTCVSISYEKSNSLKILTTSDKTTFAVNGDVVFNTESVELTKTKVGFAIGGIGSKMIDRLIIKDFDYRSSFAGNGKSAKDIKFNKYGTGFLLDKRGYLVTNNHVVENGREYVVEFTGNNGGQYHAKVVRKDKDNDLAILKITDENYKPADSIFYGIKEGALEVGSGVFTLGYPLAFSGLGTEIKFTDGKVSSKTGVDNAINMFQTTVPVQAGNSGSPLFNSKGNLIGCINATYTNTDNVSYAIKLNYLKALLETLDENIGLPSSSYIETLSIEEKIKVLSKYIAIIKVK